MRKLHESVLLTCIAALAIIQIIIVIEMLKLPASRQSVILLQNDNVEIQKNQLQESSHHHQTPVEDKCQVLKDNYTLVTAFVDIGRERWPWFRRSTKQYLVYGLRLLHLNVPLVIFVERQFVDYVIFHRRNSKYLTHIVITTFEQLEYYTLYPRVKIVLHQIQTSLAGSPFSKHPEVFSPEYVIMMASKLSFLQQAIDLNPFRSSYFYWIDFGLIRSKSDFPYPRPSSPCIPPPRFVTEPGAQNKVIYLSTQPINSTLKNIDELLANRSTPYVKASLIGGQSEPVKRYHALYRQVFERWLAANLTDDDQSLMVACYVEQPDLFYFAQQSAKCYLCNVFVKN